MCYKTKKVKTKKKKEALIHPFWELSVKKHLEEWLFFYSIWAHFADALDIKDC